MRLRAILISFIFLLASLPVAPQEVITARRRTTAGVIPLVIQTCTGSIFTTNPSPTCTFGSNVTTGNILVVFQRADSGVTIGAPTGCATWTSAGTDATTNQKVYIGTASTGSCTITASNTSGSGKDSDILAYEISNVLTTVDGTPGFAAVSFCTSCTGASTTTTFNGDMVLGIVWFSPTITYSAPFVQDVNASPGGATMAGGHDVQGSAGAIAPSWTSAGSNYVSATIAVKHS